MGSMDGFSNFLLPVACCSKRHQAVPCRVILRVGMSFANPKGWKREVPNAKLNIENPVLATKKLSCTFALSRILIIHIHLGQTNLVFDQHFPRETCQCLRSISILLEVPLCLFFGNYNDKLIILANENVHS